MTQQIRVYAADHDGNASSETFTDMADAFKRFDEERAKPAAHAVSIEVLQPPAGQLIRLWDGNFTAAGHVIASFDDGFTIPADHPVARLLVSNWQALDVANVTNVTVESTPEFHWKIRSITALLNDKVKVECEPWIEGLRKTIVSDDWYLANVANGSTDGESPA